MVHSYETPDIAINLHYSSKMGGFISLKYYAIHTDISEICFCLFICDARKNIVFIIRL